jgi:formamidopyrimidine-DNA glycosylase
MPELPDVETKRRYLQSTALHKRIKGAEVRSELVLEDISPAKLAQGVEGHRMESTRRHGKHLFVNLDHDGWLRLHFGMTGDLRYFKDGDKEPEYTLILLSLDNGYHLAYVNTRKLGHVGLLDDVDAFIAEKGLGPDALDVDFETFCDLVRGKNAMIKSTLMNQEVIAGIGNIYSDEIDFQARVHPRAQIDEMDGETLRRIYDAMCEVLETAIEHQAIPEELPDTYLITHRHPGGKCPVCGGEVKKIQVGGRSGYYCPTCQHE